MTKQEIQILNSMRYRGKSAMEISQNLHISVNTVRSYIRRHPLKNTVTVECRQCGKPIIQIKGRKGKYFCSDRCRNAWWNIHQEQINRKAYYQLICKYCGKEFESYGNKNRKYCSRSCYANARRSYPISDIIRNDA